MASSNYWAYEIPAGAETAEFVSSAEAQLVQAQAAVYGPQYTSPPSTQPVHQYSLEGTQQGVGVGAGAEPVKTGLTAAQAAQSEAVQQQQWEQWLATSGVTTSPLAGVGYGVEAGSEIGYAETQLALAGAQPVAMLGTFIGGGALTGIFKTLATKVAQFLGGKGVLSQLARFAVLSGVGSAVWQWVESMFGGGISEEQMKSLAGKKSKRYSIGKNPRLNTLLKVAKRVDNIFLSYDKRINKYRQRTSLKPRRTRVVYAGQQYLSPAEKRLLRNRR